MVERVLLGFSDEIQSDMRIWSCLACYKCKEMCTFGVEYPEFIRNIRREALKIGESGICAHSELFSLMKLFTNEKPQKRLNWTSDLEISKKGDILYFTGCLPYFDILFSPLKVDTLDIARSTVKILNKLGISPVVMPNEVCCGHDLLWNGDDMAEKLASINVRNIEDTGAKKVIFSCPECYRTFKLDYPEFVDFDFELMHISEFLSEKIDKIELSPVKEKVTYHDPCRLGRHLGIYDAPRVILEEAAKDFVELPSNRENSLCCGTSGWTNCDMLSEQIREERLGECMNVNANTLITSCPKCLIHFTCHMSNREEYNIKAIPFEVLAAKAMEVL